VDTQVEGCPWNPPDCCANQGRYHLRQPGLFKVELSGIDCVALMCKSYAILGKVSNKLPKECPSNKIPSVWMITYMCWRLITLLCY